MKPISQLQQISNITEPLYPFDLTNFQQELKVINESTVLKNAALTLNNTGYICCMQRGWWWWW